MITTKDILGPVRAPGQCETRAAMVMTLFGAFGRHGTSSALGNDLDSSFLQELRAWADIVLVSASTAAAEGYGPAETPIALLTRSLNIDPSLGVFSGGDALIACPQPSLDDVDLAPKRATLQAAGAEFVSTGAGSAPEVIGALHREGFHRIACEGGPSVYADLISHDLLDVCHVTLDPSVSADDGPWGLAQIDRQPSFYQRYFLEAALSTESDNDSMLFLRYRSVRER